MEGRINHGIPFEMQLSMGFRALTIEEWLERCAKEIDYRYLWIRTLASCHNAVKRGSTNIFTILPKSFVLLGTQLLVAFPRMNCHVLYHRAISACGCHCLGEGRPHSRASQINTWQGRWNSSPGSKDCQSKAGQDTLERCSAGRQSVLWGDGTCMVEIWAASIKPRFYAGMHQAKCSRAHLSPWRSYRHHFSSSFLLRIARFPTFPCDSVTEWLRWWTRNPLVARRGSNPLAVGNVGCSLGHRFFRYSYMDYKHIKSYRENHFLE